MPGLVNQEVAQELLCSQILKSQDAYFHISSIQHKQYPNPV